MGSGAKGDSLKRSRKGKKKDDVSKRRKGRSLFVSVVLCMVVSGLIVRIAYIKNVHGEEYEKKAIAQQISGKKFQEKIINPNRGGIYDRNKQPLALSATVYRVFLDVREIVEMEAKDQEHLVSELNRFLEISVEKLREYIAVDPETKKPVNDTKYLIIARDVPHKTITEMDEAGLMWTFHEEDTKRTYYNDVYASPVIGLIRGDSKWGLESQYNSMMMGVPGRTLRQYDTDNNAVTEQIPPEEGYSLVTTLDQPLQAMIQREVDIAAEEYEAEAVCAIVMNPNTGEILTMVQSPTFNLNEPTNAEYVKDKKFRSEYDALEEEKRIEKMYKAWGNFATQSSFEPGSIFKPVVVAAALEENIITPFSPFYCGGKKNVFGVDLPCHYGPGHGQQTLVEVLANSCNVGMMDIIELLGKNKFFKYRNEFGFGQKTGIDLPGENDVSSPYVLYPLSQLNPVELATSSFGQGFNNTPLQALCAFAAIINGGNYMKPYVVSQIIDSNNNIIKENKPQIERKVISKETSDYMRKAMQSVVSPTGTGKRAIIEGYNIGGKTGTAQQGPRKDEKHTVSFISYFPVENPEYIILATIHIVKEYQDGVTSASPLMRRIMLDIINYKNMRPSGDVQDKDVRLTDDNSFPIDDFIGKKTVDVSKKLNSLGLDCEFVGSGDTVKSQIPVPGSLVTPGVQVFIYLKSEDGQTPLVQIPSVTGLELEQAKGIIEKSSLVPVVAYLDDETTQDDAGTNEPYTSSDALLSSNQSNTENNSTVQELLVVSAQMPGSEIQVPEGTQIKLKVKKNP